MHGARTSRRILAILALTILFAPLASAPASGGIRACAMCAGRCCCAAPADRAGGASKGSSERGASCVGSRACGGGEPAGPLQPAPSTWMALPRAAGTIARVDRLEPLAPSGAVRPSDLLAVPPDPPPRPRAPSLAV